MKRKLIQIFSFIVAVGLIIAAVPSELAQAAGAGTIVYRNTQQVADNLRYTDTISYIGGIERQESYALSLQGSGDAYPIIMACDTIYGRMTIAQMITYAQSQGKNVLAAINTDFFSTKTGVPLGIVIENGVYKSSPEENTAFAFKPDGSVVFSDSPQVTVSLTNNGSALDMSGSGQTVTLTHFNKYRTDPGGLYLFSSAFSTVSTRTEGDGWFVRFRILEGAPSVSGTMSLEVVETLPSAEAVPIGDDCLVLSAGAAANLESEFLKFKTGDRVTLTTSCTDSNLADALWATGGGDILVKDGVMTDQSTWDKAISAKNPRTALGVKADGTLITYVVDGRESDNSSGLTLKCLAEELLALGCVTAVNLDGGGSSATSVRLPGTSSCAVLNKPSDGSSRKCAAYLLFVTDKKTDGVAKNLAMKNDGPVVLAGSSVDMSWFASDGGYMPVTAPDDVRAASSGLGAINGTTYTAGPVHGVDYLTLSSISTGAKGTATMHIIYDPTALRITADEKPVPQKLTLWPGETVQLTAKAFYNGLPVISDPSALKFALTADIGTVSESGLLTAGAAAGTSGSVTVTIGTKSVDIPVTVTGFNDVTSHWSKEYVKDLSGQGIVAGRTPDAFGPDAGIIRGDFVLMLYRAAGKPAVAEPASFTDVQPEDYYASAVAWAEANSIAQGDGSGKFNPKAPLTREQAFTFLYRALDDLSVSFSDGTSDGLKGFLDVDILSDYAVTPTATLVSLGIVSGTDGKLKPPDAITRAEMAKILCMALKMA